MSVTIQPTEVLSIEKFCLFECFFSSMSRCLLLASLFHPNILFHLFIFLYSLGQKKPIEVKSQKKPTEVLSKISQNSQENTCVGVSFLIMLQACNFTKKETPPQVFSCESCKIFRTPPNDCFCFSTFLILLIILITTKTTNQLKPSKITRNQPEATRNNLKQI